MSEFGNSMWGHVGYSIIIHQHPQTKILTIASKSYWQEDRRTFRRQVMASEPEGQAILDELMRLLDRDKLANRGLTAFKIDRILKHADSPSFQLQRGPEDLYAWMLR